MTSMGQSHDKLLNLEPVTLSSAYGCTWPGARAYVWAGPRKLVDKQGRILDEKQRDDFLK